MLQEDLRECLDVEQGFARETLIIIAERKGVFYTSYTACVLL